MIIVHDFDINLRGWHFSIGTEEGHCSNIFLSASYSEIERLNYLVNWLNKSFQKFIEFNEKEV